MRYLGSKKQLLGDIYSYTTDIPLNGVFCDPFGGIGTVGSFMKEKGFKVISGDILYFAHCFQSAKIESRSSRIFEGLKGITNNIGEECVEEYLNGIEPKYGWIVREYSEERQYFTYENALRIQADYDCIQGWKKRMLIDEFEYKILISSLINSFDRVANTAGTYYAFLKKFYRKALKRFVFRIIKETPGNKSCETYLSDALDLVKNHDCDILYLDPPYNNRNYQRYYHLPETIAKGVTPVPSGKSGVYVNKTINSAFNNKSLATESFEKIINATNAKRIIFHYTDNGVINIADAKNILRAYGDIDDKYIYCKGYKTTSIDNKTSHHIISVNK